MPEDDCDIDAEWQRTHFTFLTDREVIRCSCGWVHVHVCVDPRDFLGTLNAGSKHLTDLGLPSGLPGKFVIAGEPDYDFDIRELFPGESVQNDDGEVFQRRSDSRWVWGFDPEVDLDCEQLQAQFGRMYPHPGKGL